MNTNSKCYAKRKYQSGLMLNDNMEVCKIRLSEKRKILHPSKCIPVMHSETSSAEKDINFEEQSGKESSKNI